MTVLSVIEVEIDAVIICIADRVARQDCCNVDNVVTVRTSVVETVLCRTKGIFEGTIVTGNTQSDVVEKTGFACGRVACQTFFLECFGLAIHYNTEVVLNERTQSCQH